MVLVKILAVLLSVSYFFLIVYFIFWWAKKKNFFSDGKSFSTFVSIIIPVRNEEKNIENILNDIAQQNFPKNLFEVIVVDDFSEDETKLRIQSQNFREKIQNFIFVQNASQGKKNAISTGIKQAQGELIITTDADCRINKNWLSAIISFYEKEKPAMIIAPVCSHNGKTFLEKFQSLEFLSLSGIAGSSALAGNPLMCNGANLAYSKKAFFDVGGFQGNEKTPSGDDVLLMLKFKKNSKKIQYLKSRDAIVFTEPQKTFKSFIHQRKRWLSKNKFYNDFPVNFTAWFVFIFNFSIGAFAALLFFNKEFAEIFLFTFGTKIFVDFLFLLLTASFFRQKSLLWFYFPVQILYVFYAPFIALISRKNSFIWKERIYKNNFG